MREHLLKLLEKHGLGLHLIEGRGVHETHYAAHQSRSSACTKKTEEEQQQRVQKWRGRPTPGSWTSYAKGLDTWTHNLACEKSMGGYGCSQCLGVVQALARPGLLTARASYVQGLQDGEIGKQWGKRIWCCQAWPELGANWGNRSKGVLLTHPLTQQNIFMMGGVVLVIGSCLQLTCDLC